MPKSNSKSKRRQRNGNRGKNTSTPPTQQVILLKQITPIPRNPIHKFRRALSRRFTWNPSTQAIDGLAATPSLQVTFSPSTTNWRLGGTSVYNDVLPNVSEFSALYDQWKISNIEIRWDFSSQQSMNSGPTHTAPLLYYTADYDDVGNASIFDLSQLPQTRIHCFNTNGYSPLCLRLKPRPLVDVAGSGISTTYAPMDRNPWLRTADMSTPHYGMKFCYDGFGASFNFDLYFNIVIWYDLEFTNPK